MHINDHTNKTSQAEKLGPFFRGGLGGIWGVGQRKLYKKSDLKKHNHYMKESKDKHFKKH